MLITNAREPYGCLKEGWPCLLQDGETRCGHWVIEWIEEFCVATQGHWVGKPADLIPWQKDWLIELFGVNPKLGVRQYRWSLLGVPKKNGKTETAAWLGDYMLMGDEEPSPWVACAASSDKQADLVFGAASRNCEWSPALNAVADVFGSEILVPSVPGSKLMRLSAKAGTNDGPSWHSVICDEFHEWTGERGRNLWTVLTNGVGARRQPLIQQITTAGFDVEGTVCGEQFQYGLRLAEDPSLDPRYLFWWYVPDGWDEPDFDYTNPKAWKSANPSWGYTLPDPDGYLSDQLTKKTPAEFKRYFLNMWTMSEESWLEDGAWQVCKTTDPGFGLDPSLPLYVGIDGALKRDTFAVVGMQLTPEGRVRVMGKIWENPYPPGHHLRKSWKLNLDEPLNFLRELYDEFPTPAIYSESEGSLPGPAFAYDPAYLEYAAQQLEEEGLNMVEVPQTGKRLGPASEELYRLVTNKIIEHDGNQAMTTHVVAATAKDLPRGWRIAKGTSKQPIDGCIALVLGTSVLYAPESEAAGDTSLQGDTLY